MTCCWNFFSSQRFVDSFLGWQDVASQMDLLHWERKLLAQTHFLSKNDSKRYQIAKVSLEKDLWFIYAIYIYMMSIQCMYMIHLYTNPIFRSVPMSFTFAFLVLCVFESFTFLGQKSLRFAAKFLLFSGVSGFPNWEAAGRCTFSRSFFFFRIAPQRVTGFWFLGGKKHPIEFWICWRIKIHNTCFPPFLTAKKTEGPSKTNKLQMKPWQLKTSNWDFLKHKKHLRTLCAPQHFISNKNWPIAGVHLIFSSHVTSFLGVGSQNFDVKHSSWARNVDMLIMLQTLRSMRVSCA